MSRKIGDFAERFLEETSSFITWSLCMPRWVLKTKTRFAWHLRRSFSISWRSTLTSSAVLPLPVPFPGIFSGGGPKLSRKRLATLAKKRIVHVLVIILDYLFLGRFPTVEELGRHPSGDQMRCLQGLFAFATACGSRSEEFPVAPGRAGPELIACLDKLERFIEVSGLSAFGYGAADKVMRKTDSAVQKRQKIEHPQLQPYRSLNVDRLKITGQGRWPLEDYLESDLWLAYVEPRALLHGVDVSHFPFPSFEGEDRGEYLRLAQRWDELNLLHLHEEPLQEGHFCKVFNTYKSEQHDRQIGDRRIPNAREYSAGGPSRHLPTGPHLLGFLLRRGQKLLGSLTDRRDFYHQARVSLERSRSNMVPFSFSREELQGLSALEAFGEAMNVKKRQPREETGDHFERRASSRKRDHERVDLFYPSFAALFQGDHLGVEFALEAHQNLLVREGLLTEGTRLRGHAPLPLPPVWEGLIIDDYFVLGSASRSQPKSGSSVFRHLAWAREAYERHGLPGSPEKDVIAEDLFKAAGAEVDSRDSLVTSGMCIVGAPLSKRLGLSLLSLRAAALPAISSKLASRLSGSWVSVLLYRRCFAALVKEFFALAAKSEGEEKVFHLPRSAAEELAMLAAVAPFVFTDISAPVLPEVFATDASLQKGAICTSPLPQGVADRLWLDGDRKGSYTQLENGFRAALKAVGEFDEDDVQADEAENYEDALLSVAGVQASGFFVEKERIEKPPLFSFDFVEVFGGAGKVAKCMSEKGFVVGPVLDLSMSKHYDLRSLEMLNWLLYMLENKRIRSMLVEPPCTTFSPAAHPACRSYEVPLGWNRKDPKVLLGNVLAFRSLTLLYACHRLSTPAGLEQSRLSKMAWLKAWRWLLDQGCSEAVVASCMFQSPHRKEFRLLVTGLDAELLTVRCSGGHSHVRIEGKFTKPSAVYTDGVALHFANAFERALLEECKVDPEENSRKQSQSIVVNDILRSCPWKVSRSWFWKTKVHINLLEASVVVSLLKQMMKESPDCRFSILLDSAVAKGALSKGRSSSRGLQPLLMRAAACQIAGRLYPSLSHAPTKLNVADDPTREVGLRKPCKHSIFALLDLDSYRELGHHLFSPAGANWVRLTLLLWLLCPSHAMPDTHLLVSHPTKQDHGLLDFPLLLQVWIFSFGLCCLVALTRDSGFWTFRDGHSRHICSPQNNMHLYSRSHFSLLVLLMAVLFSGAVAPIAPETAVELERAQRRQHIELAADRVMRKETRENRAKYLSQFDAWLWQEHSLRLEGVVGTKTPDPEEICKWLVAYGRDLHAAGKSYNRYAETINAIGSMRPVVKRQLTAAWDLAFAWLVDEPHQHHPALPLSVLLSLTALALIWGWPLEAAIFSMTWSGLLRIGEVVSAVRKDLVLPEDSAPGISYILLKIHEPKTRGRGAKHQSARIEPIDIVRLVTAVFRRHSPSQKLWPFSAQTLRRRFSQLLSGLGLPTSAVDGVRPYDLGSLRPGGATHLLNMTEDCSLVQRRGRWLSYKVMTIYLQEITVATSIHQFPEQTRSTIENLNSVFPHVLETAILYLDWQIPCTAWYLLMRGGAT